MDRRALGSLLQAGFVDVGGTNGDRRRTVPAAAFSQSEFVPFRLDYLLCPASLARRAVRYATMDGENAGQASDHYPIHADFR